MFTGIVAGLCELGSVTDEPGIRRMEVRLGRIGEGLSSGASVAINGVCLTVARVDQATASFDVVRQTLNNTNLGALAPGSRVNVERALRFGDEVGGHVLSGHIAGTAVVDAIEAGPNERNLWFRINPDWMRYLHDKGFIALDGASLTIAEVDAPAHRIKICLIPETLARTTLGLAGEGSEINLEIDAQTHRVVETVERVLAARGLNAAGFLV